VFAGLAAIVRDIGIFARLVGGISGGDEAAEQVEKKLDFALQRLVDLAGQERLAEVPLTDLAVEALRDQMQLAGNSPYLFPSDNSMGHQTTFKTVWRLTLRRAKAPYVRIYDLRSTYATRLSAGGSLTSG